ncbi:hypothetical protein WA026_022299 [Henosepilachna vigintioctopunctata]|uniref:Uncharacterized protein n=1 Tax=Henosepilachna vigintioctopunctata TaxID=420089 RepID=A0AAW1U134_9CUCU
MENNYLKELLREVQEKNKILQENNLLLRERLKFLEDTANNVNKKKTDEKANSKKQNSNGEKDRQDEIVHPNNNVRQRERMNGTSEVDKSASDIHDTSELPVTENGKMPLERQTYAERASTKTKSTDIGKEDNVPKLKSKSKNIDENGFETVNRKRTKPKPMIGIGDIEVNKFRFTGKYKSPEEKRIWLFLSKIKDEVEPDAIKGYMEEKIGSHSSISVKPLSVKHPTSDNKCFMVGVEPKYKDMVYDPKFWPKGVAFSRFDFRQGNHFLKETLNEVTT